MTIVRGDFVRAINPKLGLPASSVWLVARTIGVFTLEPFNATAKGYPGMWRGKVFSPADFEKVTSEPATAYAPAGPAGQAYTEAPQTTFDEQIAIRQAEIKSLRQAAKERTAKDAALAAELAIIKAEQERVQRRNDLLDADQELARATAVLLAEIYRLNNGGVNQPVPTRVSQRAAELQPLAKRHGYKLAAAGTLHVLTSL